MRKLWFGIGVLILMLLSACSASTTAVAEPASSATEATVQGLSTDYTDALPIQGQLALGTVQLEGSEWAVTEEQAAVLLPLWQAMQSLSNSDTTSPVELNALLNQIAASMSAEQIQAIADMALTTQSIADLRAANGGPGGFGDGPANGGTPVAGFAGGQGGGFAGGPPGGGFAGGPPGGGPGGGFIGGDPAGGPGGAGLTGTRPSSGPQGNFAQMLPTRMVVRFLAIKTGAEIAPPIVPTATPTP